MAKTEMTSAKRAREEADIFAEWLCNMGVLVSDPEYWTDDFREAFRLRFKHDLNAHADAENRKLRKALDRVQELVRAFKGNYDCAAFDEKIAAALAATQDAQGGKDA